MDDEPSQEVTEEAGKAPIQEDNNKNSSDLDEELQEPIEKEVAATSNVKVTSKSIKKQPKKTKEKRGAKKLHIKMMMEQ